MHSNEDREEKRSEKKVYTTPQLSLYGDVRELTRTTTTPGGTADTSKNKTS
jgi:hypothetical protein